MEKRIVGYARINAPEQENAQALEQQVERLKAQGASEVFVDIGSSMAKDRTQRNLMMDLVRVGEVKEVIITRIDRLTRNIPQLSQFINAFDESGVSLRVLDQPLDLSTPTGKLMIGLMGAVAEWERNFSKDKAGIQV